MKNGEYLIESTFVAFNRLLVLSRFCNILFVGKIILMGNMPFIYTARYKHIGNLQIIIENTKSTVVSVLGIKSFFFQRLPSNRDNRYAVLRYSLKAYFNHFIENFEDAKLVKEQSTLLGSLFKMMTIHLSIGSRSEMDIIKGKIYNDYKDFSWEDVGDFFELKNCDVITHSLCEPALVEFSGSGFSSEIVLEDVVEETCYKDKNLNKAEKEAFFDKFLADEVFFFVKISEYSCSFEKYMEISDDLKKRDLIQFLKVVSIYSEIIAGILEVYSGHFKPDVLDQVKELLMKKGIDIATKECKFYDVNSLSLFYIDVFDKFNVYFDFISEYDDILHSMACSIKKSVAEAFTYVICKITNYSKVFRQMAEYDLSDNLTKLITISSIFNTRLNSEAEKSALRKCKIDLLKMSSNEFLKDRLVRGTIDALKDTSQFKIFIFENQVSFFSQNCRFFSEIGILHANIILYNKKMFIFSEHLKGVFSPDNFVSFDVFNKEVAIDFYNTFYKAKYKSEIKGKICYRLNGSYDDKNPCLYLIEPEIIVTCIDQIVNFSGKTEFYEIKIEDSSFRAGGITKVSQKEIPEVLSNFIKNKRLNGISRPNNMQIIKVLLESVEKERMVPFLINSYLEDQISFDQKNAIFDHIRHSICRFSCDNSSRAPMPADGASDHSLFLYENDILKSYDSDQIDFYVHSYIKIMKSGGNVNLMPDINTLEDLVVLLSMFLQRNLYCFIHPSDYDKFSENIKIGFFLDSFAYLKPYSRVFLKNLCEVCACLNQRLHKSMSKLIFGSVFDTPIDFDQVLDILNK